VNLERILGNVPTPFLIIFRFRDTGKRRGKEWKAFSTVIAHGLVKRKRK
jgi:hypothetical protein